MLEQLSTSLKENRKAVLFVAKLLGLYLAFQGIYDYILSPYTIVDSWLISFIISTAEWGLNALGYDLLPTNSLYTYHMGIINTPGVVIGNPCDGLSLFILYASFVIVFSGKWWTKLLFVVPGILLIHLLNVARVIALALIVKYYPETLDFHHSYTFTLFVYCCIFLLWMLRIKVYQSKKI
ncbi:MAG: archaeosortase/exosortase family protein [Vicingaceae bacterium]